MRDVVFSVLKENNALAVTFKSLWQGYQCADKHREFRRVQLLRINSCPNEPRGKVFNQRVWYWNISIRLIHITRMDKAVWVRASCSLQAQVKSVDRAKKKTQRGIQEGNNKNSKDFKDKTVLVVDVTRAGGWGRAMMKIQHVAPWGSRLPSVRSREWTLTSFFAFLSSYRHWLLTGKLIRTNSKNMDQWRI